MSVLEVPRRDLQVGRLARAEGARGDDRQRLRLHHGDPLPRPATARARRRPCLNRSIAVGRVALLVLEDRRRSGTGRARRARCRGTCRARVSQAAIASSNFFSAAKLSPTWKRTCGTRRVERVLGDERLPGGAGLGVLLAAEEVGGDQELGVEDRPLGVGRLRAVGELGEVALARRRSPRRTSPGPGGSGRPGRSPSSRARPGRASPRRSRPGSPRP